MILYPRSRKLVEAVNFLASKGWCCTAYLSMAKIVAVEDPSKIEPVIRWDMEARLDSGLPVNLNQDVPDLVQVNEPR
jgi:hypothetical protein